jgi:DNA-binding LytR/AlgR family response regulator
MTKVIICDDESSERAYLSALTREWAAERGIAVRVTEYDSAEALLFAYEDDKAVDILLLDIQMKEMDGVTLAKRIRADNKEVQIIFVTGYMEYIADGYDVEALHYLLKPVTGEKLFAVLDRAKDKLARNERALFINRAGESVRIPLYEIRYIEVLHNYVTIYANDEHKVKKTLNEMESELNDDYFLRVGRSFIVNLRHITKCTRTEIHIKNSAVIPLPRGMYDAVNRAMIERL